MIIFWSSKLPKSQGNSETSAAFSLVEYLTNICHLWILATSWERAIVQILAYLLTYLLESFLSS